MPWKYRAPPSLRCFLRPWILLYLLKFLDTPYRTAYKKLVTPTKEPCFNTAKYDQYCGHWADRGLCKKGNKYYGFMNDHCRKTCKFCTGMAESCTEICLYYRKVLHLRNHLEETFRQLKNDLPPTSKKLLRLTTEIKFLVF